jgi:hypothetical protein
VRCNVSEWNTVTPKSAVCVVERGERNHLRVATVERCFVRASKQIRTPHHTPGSRIHHSFTTQSILPLKEVENKEQGPLIHRFQPIAGYTRNSYVRSR